MSTQKYTEDGLPVFGNTPNVTDDGLPIFDVKKKEPTEEELESFKTSMRGVSQMPKEYASEAPSTQVKEENKSFAGIQSNIDNYYQSRGGMKPQDKISAFDRRVKQTKRQFELNIKDNPSKQQELIDSYNKEVKDIAYEYGLVEKDGTYSVNENDIKLYKEVLQDSYDKYVKQLPNKNRDNFVQKTGKKLSAGAERFLNIPVNALAVSETISNAVTEKASGSQSTYWQDRAAYLSNEATKKSQEAKVGEGDIVDALRTGDVGEAVGNLVLDIAEQVPQLVTFWAGNAVGVTNASLGLMGAQVGTEKFVQNKEAGVGDLLNSINSLTSSLVEVTSESLGTLPVIEQLNKAIMLKGSDVAKKEIAEALRTPLERGYATLVGGLKPMASQSAEEVSAELANQIVDKYSINPDIKIGEGLADLAVSSAIIGKLLSAPSEHAGKKTREQVIDAYNQVPDDYTAASKLDATELILKVDELEELKKGKNKILSAKYKEKINEINDQLLFIAEKEDKAIELNEQINELNKSIESKKELGEDVADDEQVLSEITKERESILSKEYVPEEIVPKTQEKAVLTEDSVKAVETPIQTKETVKTDEIKPDAENKEENIFNLREKELSLQQKEYERSYEEKQRGVTPSEMGGVELRGEDVEGGLGETPRYDVAGSDRLSGHDPVKEISIPDNEANEIKTTLGDKVVFDTSFEEVRSAEKFHESISKSKEGNKYSASVFIYPTEEYQSSKLFLTKDGKAGVAITKDGDIISVFSHGEGKGRTPQLIINAVKEGGVSLDHYDTKLTHYYAQFGFVPVARVKWNDEFAPEDWDKEVFKGYNNGEPDVIAMAYHGGDPNTLYQRVGKFPDIKELLDKTPYVDTWEEAKKIQQEYVQKLKQEGGKYAVQEPSTEKVDVRKRPSDGEEVGERNIQEEKVAKEGEQKEKEVKKPIKPPKVPVEKAKTSEEAEQKVLGMERKTEKEQGVFQSTESEQQKFVQNIVDANKGYYNVLTYEEASQQAKEFIAEQGTIENAFNALMEEDYSFDEAPIRQVARFNLMDFYSRKAIDTNLSEQEQNDAASKVLALEKVAARSSNKFGQANAMNAIWKLMQPEAVLKIEERRIEEYNNRKLDKKIQGKTTIKQQIKNLKNTIDTESKNVAGDIIKKNKKYKEKRDKISDSDRIVKQPKKKQVSKEQIQKEREYRKERIERYKRERRSQASATILPGITQADIEFAGDMVASYLREGYYRVAEITNKLRKEFNDIGIDLTDEQLKQILDQKQDGERLIAKLKKEEAKNLIPESASVIKKAKITTEQKESVSKKIDDVVNSHWDKKDSLGRDLVQKLMDDADLTEQEAKEISDIVLEDYNNEIQKRAEKELLKLIGRSVLPKQRVKRQTVTDKLFKALNLGALDDAYYTKLFAEYFGLKELTPEEAKQIIKKAKAVHDLRGKFLLAAEATKELANYIHSLYPEGEKSFIDAYSSLIYASVLSGPFTSVLNMWSAGWNITLKPLRDALNYSKWIDVIRKHNTKEAKAIYNPIGELFLKPAFAGTKFGSKEAAQVYKEGGIDNKYIDQIANNKEFKVQELERNKYGEGKRFKPIRIKGRDYNFFNLYKYVSRNLLAQDRFMYNTSFSTELASIIADKVTKEKGLKGKELRKEVLKTLKGLTLDQNILNTRVENDIALYEELMGKKATDLMKKIYRNQVMIDMLELTPEEKLEADEIARGNIFTDDRGGVVAHAAYALGRWTNSNPFWKVVAKPFFMFTKIVGNVTEYMLDYAPFYSYTRANGWSFSGVYKRIMDNDMRTAQMGEKGTRAYYEQMGRAHMGTTSFILLLALGMGSDDDDWFQITGGRNKEGYKKQGRQNITPNYTMRFGKVNIPYLNIPPLAIPLGLIGNINDAILMGMPDEEIQERFTAALLFDAVMATTFMVKDMSVVQGMSSLAKMVTDMMSLDDKKLESVSKEMVKRYLGLALKPLPQNTNIVKQVEKFFDPQSYSQKDIQEMLSYAMGLQHYTELNQPTADQLGDNVKSYPGENFLPLSHWFGLKGGDDRWKFLSKYNAIPNRLNNSVLNVEVEGGFEKRNLEPEEFYEYTKLAGSLFSDKLRKYMVRKDVEEKYKDVIVDPRTEDKTTQLNVDIENLRSDAIQEAKSILFMWGIAKEEKPELFEMAKKYNIVKPYQKSKTVTVDNVQRKLKDNELYSFNTLASLKYLDLINSTILKDKIQLNKLYESTFTDPKTGVSRNMLDVFTDVLWEESKEFVTKTQINDYIIEEEK